MSKKLILIAFLAILGLGLYSQRPTLELTFTADNIGTYVQMDSIKIMNLTQGGDTMLYYPDNVLALNYQLGISEINLETRNLRVFQNYPNPVAGHTTISMYVPENDKVSMIMTDILGRVILKQERVLEKGLHSFRYTPGRGNLYFFTAQWRGNSSSIKILQTVFNSSGTSSLEYIGIEGSSPQLKALKDVQIFPFSIGDVLLFIGYAGALESGTLDSPVTSETYTFQFATNIPCPGTPTVSYEGQVYNTIQIFSQCWLKENLNVGGMMPGEQWMQDNGRIEKYCYYDEPDSCAKYGGLYQWWEVMQYTTQPGSQGICPPGWHLPTDEEWKVLEGAVDSQYGIGDPQWDISWEYRGYDAGTNLKTTSGWNYDGNGTDLFGFSGLPGGSRGYQGFFAAVGSHGYWWSSTGHDYFAWYHYLYYYSPGVVRDIYGYEGDGYSVRCLRDY